MADGDNEWNRNIARADYDVGPLDPSPLAIVLPSSRSSLHLMGSLCPSSDTQSRDVNSGKSEHYSAPPHSIALISNSLSSSSPPALEHHVATDVHVSTPDYALLTQSAGSLPFPKGEIPYQQQTSAIWDTTAAPVTHLSQVSRLRSSLHTAAAVPCSGSESADFIMPPPLAIREDKHPLDHTEPHRVLCNFNQSDNVTPLTASRTRPSKNSPPSNSPSTVRPLPPVPDSVPRDPVPQAARGEGWPYAPQGWPNADDKWGWRVGKRASSNSLWIDRYVILPISLLKNRRPGKPAEFASRKGFAEYFKQNFPEIDPDSLFKAFDWKVPAPKSTEGNEAIDKRGSAAKRDKTSSTNDDDGCQMLKKQCRASNPDCPLLRGGGSAFESLESLVCRICCSEPGFCRECKCVLCCETFLPDADEVSIIRCRNFPVSEGGVCGHASHLECALASQLAGSNKKNGLDMEYICRRCDRKMDLRDTFTRLIEVMSKTVLQSKVENSLQLALRMVQDPDEEARSSGRDLTTLIGDALRKVRLGADVSEAHATLTKQLLGLQTGQVVYASEVSHQVQNGKVCSNGTEIYAGGFTAPYGD